MVKALGTSHERFAGIDSDGSVAIRRLGLARSFFFFFFFGVDEEGWSPNNGEGSSNNLSFCFLVGLQGNRRDTSE